MKFSDVLSQVIDLAKKANAARANRASEIGGFPAVTSGVQVQGIHVQGPSGLVAVPPGPPISGSPVLSPAPSGPPVMLMPLPEESALRKFLESQSPETVYMLAAVMYLGRGDFDADRLRENYAIMGDRFGGRAWAARQMADKISLPQYLKEGLRKADEARMDLDAMVSTETAQTEAG